MIVIIQITIIIILIVILVIIRITLIIIIIIIIAIHILIINEIPDHSIFGGGPRILLEGNCYRLYIYIYIYMYCLFNYLLEEGVLILIWGKSLIAGFPHPGKSPGEVQE